MAEASLQTSLVFTQLLCREVENTGGSKDSFVLVYIYHQKCHPRESCFQSVVTNPSNGCSTIGVTEGLSDDTYKCLSSVHV